MTETAGTAEERRAPAGIDEAKVGRWIAQRFGVEQVAYSVLSVGRSNLTFTVDVDGEPRWVLRRPPLGHKGGSAHDVAREGRFMQALGPTDVPVPNVLEIVDDPEVMEVPFVFQDYCDGFTLHEPGDMAKLPCDPRETGFDTIEALAKIHAVDLDAVGLGDLRRPGGFVERQLRRWQSQFEAVTTRDLPIVAEVQGILSKSVPEEGPAGLVHGDYKPNNMLYSRETGRVAAVVDWELSSTGEVTTDLGYYTAMLTVPDELTSIWTPGPADGFPSADELIEHYVSLTGRDVSNVPYYAAFAVWKLACIREGVYTRLINGQMGDLPMDPEEAGAGVEQLAAYALEILKTGSLPTRS